MTKKEKNILLEEYGYQYQVEQLMDKDIRFYKDILDKLGLYNDRINIENEVYYMKNELSTIKSSTYENLNDIIEKSNDGKRVNVEVMEVYLDEIEYQATDEHKKCIKASKKNYIRGLISSRFKPLDKAKKD